VADTKSVERTTHLVVVKAAAGFADLTEVRVAPLQHVLGRGLAIQPLGAVPLPVAGLRAEPANTYGWLAAAGAVA
jgi:hypothetical protein